MNIFLELTGPDWTDLGYQVPRPFLPLFGKTVMEQCLQDCSEILNGSPDVTVVTYRVEHAKYMPRLTQGVMGVTVYIPVFDPVPEPELIITMAMPYLTSGPVVMSDATALFSAPTKWTCPPQADVVDMTCRLPHDPSVRYWKESRDHALTGAKWCRSASDLYGGRSWALPVSSPIPVRALHDYEVICERLRDSI